MTSGTKDIENEDIKRYITPTVLFMSRKKEYTYRPGEPDRWDDYRKSLHIVGYSWAVRRQAERQRRRRKVLRLLSRVLWTALMFLLLWLTRRI